MGAAAAGLGPLFGSIQPHLLETPQNFIDDPVPLIAKAASARLAYLDAERAANDKSMTPAALKRFTDREIERMEEAQAGFELRVAERVTTLERRCEAGEKAVHAAVAVIAAAAIAYCIMTDGMCALGAQLGAGSDASRERVGSQDRRYVFL